MIQTAGVGRTERDTAHTGDTALFIRMGRVFSRNGACRTAGGAQAAALAGFACFWHQRYAIIFTIGPAAGERNRQKRRGLTELLQNGFCEGGQFGGILRVRPTGCKLTHNGMFSYRGNACHTAESRMMYQFLQLQQRIFVGAVSVGNHKDGSGAVPLYLCNPPGCRIRNPPSIGGNRYKTDILRFWSILRKVNGPVCQIHVCYVRRKCGCQDRGDFFCSTCGTECKFIQHDDFLSSQ